MEWIRNEKINENRRGSADAGFRPRPRRLRRYERRAVNKCFTQRSGIIRHAKRGAGEHGPGKRGAGKCRSGIERAPLTGTEGKLIMGTNAEFPPYEYYEGEKIVGIDAEIAAKLAEKLGLELQIEDMAFDAIIAAVESGKIDMGMAGMTVDETRLQSVNFTTSYATGVQVIIVPENSEITSVDDLNKGGYTIGVQNATTGDLYATWNLEDEGLATVDRYNKGADAVMALTTGKIDCVIIDTEPAKAFVAATRAQDSGYPYAVEDYAIAVNKDNEALLEALDTALQELIDDGTVAAIVDKYIGD
jgi:polar amino acid transport system substrate-binding protein